jgi:hypothetical protein
MPTASCWLDSKDGRFFGAVASRRFDLQIYFWADENGRGTHPDARLAIAETTVAPSAVWTPAKPVYLICVAGTGGSAAWLKCAQELGVILGR